MCGRFVASTPVSALAEFFDAEVPSFDTTPNFNVAPTMPIVALLQDSSGRHLDRFAWGLSMPSKAPSENRPPVINARAESVAEKPTFRGLLAAHRCVVPVTGYYEWRTTKASKKKIPFYIHDPDGLPLALAGLWRPRPGNPLVEGEVCIITVEANAALSAIHNRMPAVLEAEEIDIWLNAQTPEALGVLDSADDDRLAAEQVFVRVNSVRNNDPSNIEPVEEQLEPSLFD